MVLERVEVNSLKAVHYYWKQNLLSKPYLFINSKESSGNRVNLTEIEILSNMATFQTR